MFLKFAGNFIIFIRFLDFTILSYMFFLNRIIFFLACNIFKLCNFFLFKKKRKTQVKPDHAVSLRNPKSEKKRKSCCSLVTIYQCQKMLFHQVYLYFYYFVFYFLHVFGDIISEIKTAVFYVFVLEMMLLSQNGWCHLNIFKNWFIVM